MHCRQTRSYIHTNITSYFHHFKYLILDLLNMEFEKIWVIGDSFVRISSTSYPTSFGNAALPFGTDKFAIEFYTQDSYEVRNRNSLARINNSLTLACNTSQTPLIPKWIVVIPETDIMETLDCNHYGISAAYGMMLEYLMKRFDTILKTFVDFNGNLPARINKSNRPHVLWVVPTLHMGYSNNGSRSKFIRSMHNVVQFHSNVIVLPLKQGWMDDQPKLVLNSHPSPRGYEQLWRAIDNTIKYADTKLMRNHGLTLPQVFQKNRLMTECEHRLTCFERRLRIRNKPSTTTLPGIAVATSAATSSSTLGNVESASTSQTDHHRRHPFQRTNIQGNGFNQPVVPRYRCLFRSRCAKKLFR